MTDKQINKLLKALRNSLVAANMTSTILIINALKTLTYKEVETDKLVKQFFRIYNAVLRHLPKDKGQPL